MPAPKEHILNRVVVSPDYHDEKVTIDFYTNSAIAIYRGDEDGTDNRVWLDNIEKRELLVVLMKELIEYENSVEQYDM